MNFRIERKALLLIAFAAFGASRLMAGLFTVNPTDNAATLAQTFLGPGIAIVGTPALSSQPGQSGTFTDFNSGPYTQAGGGSGQYNIPSGFVLTTGVATAGTGYYIGGPNADLSGSGNPLLSALAGTNTFDADTLTIQFTSANPTLSLNYAFASAEYPNSVGSQFVDAFGIFVNGTNIALVPGTTTPVSINGVNAGVNSKYFTQYSNPGTPFNYGGVTTLLTARANVSTTSVNTIQFAIADASDGNVDSALFVQGAGGAAAVPEPASLLLFSVGLVFFGAVAGLRRESTTRNI